MENNLREKLEKGKVVINQIRALTKGNPEFDVTMNEVATKLGMDTEGFAAVQMAALVAGGVREVAAFVQIGIVLGMAYERKCRQEATKEAAAVGGGK